jgi:hypothetical protein
MLFIINYFSYFAAAPVLRFSSWILPVLSVAEG